MGAAFAAVKTDKLKKLLVVFASNANPEGLRAAVSAVADASYSYTPTKSRGEARTLQSVLVGAGNADAHRRRRAFDAV